jgi:hypothetical protein
MRYGRLSLLMGFLAVVCAVGAWHAQQVRMPGSGHVLNWFENHGLVSSPDPGRVVEIGSASVILLTDGFAIWWIQLHSWWFAGAALLLALWADFKGEDTLYPSAGFVCGGLALAMYSPSVAAAVAVAGTIWLSWQRGRRRA